MAFKRFNTALINAVKEHAPDAGNMTRLLCEVLKISEEAVYRRLRGDVRFSFGEAAVMASRFDFSLNNLLGKGMLGTALFRLNLTERLSRLEDCCEVAEREIRLLKEMISDPSAELAFAGNSIPQLFYLDYDRLTAFKLYKWRYQQGLCEGRAGGLRQMTVPATLAADLRELAMLAQQIPLSHYIFDESCFSHWVQDIRAFRRLDQIDDREVRMLCDELSALLGFMERIAEEGCYPTGQRVNLYVSDLDLETSFCTVTTDKRQQCFFEIFSANTLQSNDVRMCGYVRREVQAQSRFATLISRSCEVRRKAFFRRQREVLAGLEREGW